MVVSGTNSLVPPGVTIEVPGDLLCNIPFPDDHIYVKENTGYVFNNCKFNFVNK